MMVYLLKYRTLTLPLLAFALSMIAGCAKDQQELENWMQEQRAEIKPAVEPIEPPKRFLPRAYEVADKYEPFDAVKKMESVMGGPKHPCALLLAEQSRRRQPLEAYPLDAITMVGSYVKKGQPYALLSVSDHLYPAKVGDYIGQNYGKIMRVTESEISLREIGQDPAGECEERTGTLQLQEKSR